MEYKLLIKIVENRRNKLLSKNKTLFNRKLIKKYINKYDALLLYLYTKYEEKLNSK